MNRRGFTITALVGCGLLVLLAVVAIPVLFLTTFRGITIGRDPALPGTGGEEVAAPTQAAIPTFTPAPVQDRPASETQQGTIGVDSDVLTGIYEQVNPGVVSIAVNVDQGGVIGQGSGSGFLIDEQGHIVTNNHVVSGASSITVVFFEGTQVNAEIVGLDDDSDLAVVKVESIPDAVHPLSLSDSDDLSVGEWVVAIGNPFTLSNSMTFGIISALGRTISSEVTPFSIPQVIQTDAAINPGNSGGPLINMRGEVIGVNAQIATANGVRANAGVGFAIPANIVRRVVPVLIEQGGYAWPWLGVQGITAGELIRQANNLEQSGGAYLADVVNGGPADEAGLRGSSDTVEVDGLDVPVGGDVVVEAGGQPVKTFDDLLNVIAFRNPGDTLDLTVIRDGSPQQFTVTLGQRPDSLESIP